MHPFRTFRAALLGITLAAAGSTAGAQFMPDYGTYGAPMSNFLTSSHLVSQAALGAVSAGQGKSSKPYPSYLTLRDAKEREAREKGRAGAAERRSGPAIVAPSERGPIAPARLAAGYPPAQRAKAERLFLETLEGYHDIERKFGLPRNDIAGAVATFVAGNYIAYHDQPFPDAHFRPLVEQMRDAVAGMPGLRNARDAEKQEFYEHLAILGTYMALTREGLQQSRDPALKAGMARAARNYLEQFLKVDPDRLRIGPQGLVVQ